MLCFFCCRSARVLRFLKYQSRLKPPPISARLCRTPTRHWAKSNACLATETGLTKLINIAISSPSRDTRPKNHALRSRKHFSNSFHGDGQEERIYFETGANQNGPLAYITDWANNDARTEGMSYGMMIAVQLNKKREFDAIWNWSKTYMLITDPKNPSVGYFAWSMNTDGTPRSTGAAPDGEEYYVMALYFAAHRWGNGQGIYNYKAEADKILRGMRHHPVLNGE